MSIFSEKLNGKKSNMAVEIATQERQKQDRRATVSDGYLTKDTPKIRETALAIII